MKWLIVLILVVALLAGAVVAWLAFTAPGGGEQVRFPLSPAHRELLGRVPPSAELYALIPSPAALEAKLVANPSTGEAVARWVEGRHLPGPWLLGRAAAVAWRTGPATSYAIRFDPVRAVLARIWLSVSAVERAEWEGDLLVVETEPTRGSPFPEHLAAMAAALPPGDLFVVQTSESRDYPPIGRPAVSSASVTEKEIVVVSRAAAGDSVAGTADVRGSFPRGAMLAASFVDPPRILRDLGRVLGTDLPALVAGGGAVALYDVDRGTLVPRPLGVVVIPRAAEQGEALVRVEALARAVGETRLTGSTLLVAFDRGSLDRYVADEMLAAHWPANRWSMRIDPQTLLPVLDKLSESAALRFAAPRVHRSVRNLERWSSFLAGAESIEAADSVASGAEELRLRIVSK